jgi:uncharacterized repeat protein (TIGR01451 family)
MNIQRRSFTMAIAIAISLVTPSQMRATDFAPPQSYPVGTKPVAIATGDFNGDGKLDLAVLNNTSEDISILFGNGDGTFKATINTPVSHSGNGPSAFAVGDFNGDKKLDIVVVNSGDPTNGTLGVMNLLLGNGDGTFQAPIQIQAGQYPFTVAVADLNGDKRLDLIVGDQSDASLTILLGKGDGTFLTSATIPLDGAPSTPIAVLSILAGDFNGDNKQDLVAGVSGGPLSILIGKGNGSFQPPVQIGTTKGGPIMLAGDFNSDHNLDLVVRVPVTFCFFGCHTSYHTALLLGNGDGTFASPSTVSLLSAGSLASGDFNADDKLDLYAGGLFLGNNSGGFLAVPLVTGTTGSFAVVGDFNGDNLPDLAITDDTNNAVVVVLNSSPTSGADLAIAVNPTQANVTVGGGDLTYMATLFSEGPQDASGVTLTETLPASWKFKSVQPSQGTCSGTTTITCDLGSMTDPSSTSVQFTVTPTASGTFSDSLSVAATQPDLNMKNNSASISVTAVLPADIAVSATDSESTGSTGDKVTYTVTVSNNGPATATNVSLADSLSDNLPVSSLSAMQGSCVTAPSSITCALGTLASGASAKVAFAITLQTTELFTNSLSVSADQPDLNSANNSTTVSVAVNPADLAVSETGSPNPAVSETQTTYTIKVSNGGPVTANNVTLTDSLPQNVSAPAAMASQGSCTAASNGQITCSLGALAAAATATVTLAVTPTAAGQMTNNVSVSANEPDPNPSNNSATFTTNVGDFSVTPTSAVLSLQRGGSATDAITIAAQDGFSNNVDLTCTVSGPSPVPGCSLSPSSVSAGVNAITSTLTITAPASAAFVPAGFLRPGARPIYTLALLALLLGLLIASPKVSRRQICWRLCGGFAVLLVLFLAACGGGGSLPQSENFTATVTAKSGALVHSTSVALSVN